MAFRSSPRALGTFSLISGTRKKDSITGTGLQAVFAGGGNDILIGKSTVSTDGLYQNPPILVGGAGNDTYKLGYGIHIIADLDGGNDTVISSLDLDSSYFYRVNNRDILLSDGNSTLLFYDPFGTESQNNIIEKATFGKKSYTINQLYDLAVAGGGFAGDTTYSDLDASGYLDLSQAGINPNRVNEFIANAKYNSSLVA
jgi:hypothetical protein